jgi:molecular chaperone Hsp33
MEKSRQYSFINNKYGFTLSLIEGHTLIDDISKIHNIGDFAREFYQKTVLSTQQLVNFIKPGESLGFYIDSESPYFRFKIEMSQNGSLRTLLLPEEFDDFPKTFTGKCRITKIFAQKSPYTSILEFNDHPIENIVNEVMEKSYQTNSFILTSEDVASSLMITKLPPTNINKKIEDFEDISIKNCQKQFKDLISSALKLKSTTVAQAEELFVSHGFTYIGSKEIKFDCPCSKDRMISNLHSLPPAEIASLFVENPYIETRCDYCNTNYQIQKEDISKPIQ